MISTFQGNYAEAGPLFERTQAIREKVLGPGHEHVADVLNNRAMMLEEQVKIDINFYRWSSRVDTFPRVMEFA